MKYRGNTIKKTSTTTTRPGLGIRYLYRIEGPQGKEEGRRPFITTIKQAKDFIKEQR